jgi:hypothetical protein
MVRERVSQAIAKAEHRDFACASVMRSAWQISKLARGTAQWILCVLYRCDERRSGVSVRLIEAVRGDRFAAFVAIPEQRLRDVA